MWEDGDGDGVADDGLCYGAGAGGGELADDLRGGAWLDIVAGGIAGADAEAGGHPLIGGIGAGIFCDDFEGNCFALFDGIG